MEPYCIVDVNKITRAYSTWKKWLPEIDVFYAVKCNSNPVVLKHMHSLGIQFDCASKKEMEMVEKIAPASSILFAHPMKIPTHLTYASEIGVPTVVFDSISELYKIKQNYPSCQLLLRLWVKNTPGSPLSNKFGADLYEVPTLLQKANALNLKVIGFSFHVGSPCEEPQLYYQAFDYCKTAAEMASLYNISITTIDIGGGFQENNFEACAVEVRRGMSLFDNVRFISEVGRFLVASSHRLYVHVIGKKIKDIERIYYINDGIYGTFSCKLFDHATPEFKTDRKGDCWPSAIYGPTCDSLDIVEEKLKLPNLEIGDCLYVDNYGAYTLSSCFNGYEMCTFLYGEF